MNEHFVNDGAPINQAASGIPPCTPTAPPPATNAQKAINWATGYVNRSNLDAGLCLTFDFAAWSAANVNLRNYVNVGIGSNTYPQNIWGHFTQGTTGTGTPPAGALVFFNAKPGRSIIYSHVMLSVGGGNNISTADTFNEGSVHYETLAQHAASGSYNTYVGWWLP